MKAAGVSCERSLNVSWSVTYKFGKGSVIIWRCFWFALVGPLANVHDTQDQDRQVDILAEVCTHGWKVGIRRILT